MRQAIPSTDPTVVPYDAHLDQAKLLLAHGNAADSLVQFRRALKIGPESAELHAMIAQALIASGNGGEAETHLRRAIELDSANATALAMLGYRLQTRGRFKEARELFEKSILIQPRQSVSYYGLIQGRTLTRDDHNLVGQIEQLLEEGSLEPHDEMYLWYALGKAYEDLGELEKSMQAFERANQLAFQHSLCGRPFRKDAYVHSLDRMIRVFNKESLRRHKGLGLKSRRPIFIVGMMRSGTTLVEQILSSHSLISAGGELDFWLDNWPRAFDARGERLDPSAVPKLAKAYIESLPPERERVTDKMPQNFQVVGLLHIAFPNAPIIHVSRDARDNCLSIFTTAYEVSPEYAHDKASIAFAYKQYQRVMAHWRSVIPEDRLLDVSYEELVTNREEVVRRMVRFCGLEWDDACLSHEANERVVHTPSLWQVRQPVYSSSVGRWKRFERWIREFELES